MLDRLREDGDPVPVITFPYAALAELLARGSKGAVPPRPAVVEALGEMGCAVDGPDNLPDLSVEALMNRPDLFSVEGIARALRTFLALGGPPAAPVVRGNLKVHVDPAVLPVRPEIACAVVRGAELDALGLRLLLDAQEKLDLTYGRKRARVSVGLHDLAPVVGPITYTAVAPPSASFVPLFADALPGGPRALNLADILALHPKGQAYAHILKGAAAFPLLRDARGSILSFPPIINGVLTELKPGRRDVFIDVTGTSRAAVAAAAKLLALVLAERGGAIESVEVLRPGEPATREPDLAPSRREVSLARASALLGIPLDAAAAAAALSCMGHACGPAEGGAALAVESPPWRFDLLHEVDLIEDIAVGLRYVKIPGSLPRRPTTGAEHAQASAARRARATLLGLGFLEVVTLTLGPRPPAPSPAAAAPGAAATGAGAPAAAPPATVENPITAEHSTARASLVPSLLAVLTANTHRDLPQAIFEVGDAVLHHHNRTDVAAVYLGADASFTRAKGVALSVLAAFGHAPRLAPLPAAGDFVPGRAAAVVLGGAEVGAFGELAPAALAARGLVHPAFALEFALAPLGAAPGT